MGSNASSRQPKKHMSGHAGSQEQSLRHSEPTQSQMSGHDGSQEQSL